MTELDQKNLTVEIFSNVLWQLTMVSGYCGHGTGHSQEMITKIANVGAETMSLAGTKGKK